MENDEMLALLAALILPTVKADMGEDAEDLYEAIEESVLYAADIVEAVKAHMEEPDGDDGEKVEVIPPRRRHA